MNTRDTRPTPKATQPEPVEHIDFYPVDKINHTITFTTEVTATSNQRTQDIITQAGKSGNLHGEIVASEVVGTVRLDMITDRPFDEEVWRAAKIEELRVKKPWENLHKDQMNLSDFGLWKWVFGKIGVKI